VSASNQNLEDAVRRAEFRQDLFYRLNVVPIRLPDLQHRREDIPLLVHHFLQKFADQHGEGVRRFNSDAMRILMTHAWPGNVRELENAVEHALTMGGGDVLTAGDLPASVASPDRDVVRESAAENASLEEVERRYILSIMEKVGGHQINAARVLGIDRRTLYRRLRQYGYKPGRNGPSRSRITPEDDGKTMAEWWPR
jgi:DNA-binding NtrC family response regulator